MSVFFCCDTPLVAPVPLMKRRENIHVFYRARVILPENFTDPILRFYATSLTEIAVNGKSLHYGPSRSSEPLLFYDELRPELKAGENCFAFHQCVDREKGEFGILAELEISVGGQRHFLLGDASGFEAGYFQSYATDAPLNSGTGYAEYVTLGSGEEAWRQGVFPGECPPARATGRIIPGTCWRSRPIPLFREQRCDSFTVSREEDGSLLLDFGRLRNGRPELSGAANGTVAVEYIEDLDGGWSTPSGSIVMYDDRLFSAKGEFHWKAHHKRAGRYVRLRGVEPGTFQFAFQEYSYPLRQSGDFHSSDPFLDRLAEISAETLKLCMEDIYTDCPHRDQEQWMDALVSSRAATGLFGVRDLTRKCLLQYACGIRDDGQLHSPSISGTGAVPDYTLLFFPFLLHYYRTSGDLELLRELYPVLKRILEGFRRHETSDHLLHFEAGMPDFVYLDNTFELAKRGCSTALNALYLRALSDFAEISTFLGKEPEKERADTLRRTILDQLGHPRIKECFRDNLVWPEGGFLTVNFSCELEHWDGGTGLLEFDLYSSSPARKALEVADYAGFRLYLNGKFLKDRPRHPLWSREPMYDPERVELPLEAGCNRVRFEVPWNALNWELFLRNADAAPLEAQNVVAGEPGSGLRPVRLRNWIPPELSQSTQAYAAFAGVYPDSHRTLAMLRHTLREEYPRTYRSVRVPSFCTEAGEAREGDQWVMPCNTPWPTFFLLVGLFENGGGQEGLEVIRRYWRDMVQAGATTTAEEWGRRSSLCHAWGASPVYFLQHDILGVRHETLHTGSLLIRPNLCDLEFARGNVAIDAERSLFIALRRTEKEVSVTLKAPGDIPVQLDLSLLGRSRLSEDSVFSEFVPCRRAPAVCTARYSAGGNSEVPTYTERGVVAGSAESNRISVK